MRIHYLHKAILPSRAANAIQVMQMCQALVRLGHDVTLLVARPHDSAMPMVDWQDYGVTQPFRILPLTLHRSRFGSMLFGLKAVRVARREGTCAILTRHVHTAVAAAWHGIPAVFEWHALQNNVSEKLYVHAMAPAPRPPVMAFISNALRLDFETYYPGAASKLHSVIVPDGVDVDRFNVPEPAARLRRELGLPVEGHLVGYAGSFYPGRGILEIVAPLANRCRDVHFLLVGGSPEDRRQVTHECNVSGLNNVTVVGFVPNRAVPRYLAACDVLLAPYQKHIAVRGGGDTSRWCSPLKLFEYMASGRPMIVSDLPVFHEFLHENNCFFCPPNDPDAWVAALAAVQNRPDRASELARRAAEDALNYSWEGRAVRCLSALTRTSQAAGPSGGNNSFRMGRKAPS